MFEFDVTAESDVVALGHGNEPDDAAAIDVLDQISPSIECASTSAVPTTCVNVALDNNSLAPLSVKKSATLAHVLVRVTPHLLFQSLNSASVEVDGKSGKRPVPCQPTFVKPGWDIS